jgi:hypothetical protein
MASASSAAVVAAEVQRLAAEERAADAELRATLSQIAELQSCGEPEPEPEPEPDADPALVRTLTQEAYSRLVEHPKLSAAERERVRSVAAARQERKAAGVRSEEEGDDDEEEDDDDGAGTGLFFRHPSNPARTWSQERLDAASMELEALREIQHVRGPPEGSDDLPLARVDSQVAQASELERVWMDVAALREQLGLG